MQEESKRVVETRKALAEAKSEVADVRESQKHIHEELFRSRKKVRLAREQEFKERIATLSGDARKAAIDEQFRQKVLEKQGKPSFEATPTFKGALKGYFFSTGDHGVGYYPDPLLTRVGAATAKARMLDQAAQRQVERADELQKQLDNMGAEQEALEAQHQQCLQDVANGGKTEPAYGRCTCGGRLGYGVK